jgi:putative nucleotidyltransferase with HDIG domain
MVTGKDAMEHKQIGDELGRLAHETERYVAGFEAVNRILTTLRSEQPLDELISRLLDEILALLGIEAGLIWLYDMLHTETDVAVARGWLMPMVELLLKPQTGFAERVFATGFATREGYVTREFVSDLRSGAPDLPIPAGWGGACLPLRAMGETIGGLCVSVQLPREMQAGEVHVMTVLAEIIGGAVQRIRLHEQSQRRAEQLITINEIGRAFAETLDLGRIYERLAQAIHQLLPDISTVLISLYNPDQRLITCTYAVHDHERLDPNDFPPIPLEAPGVGTQSQVIRTRQPLIANDLQAEVKQAATSVEIGTEGAVVQSGMYVPMLAENRVIGVMMVQSYTLNRFSLADAEVLGIVGNSAAVAIENTRLFDHLQRSNAELALAYDATIQGWSHALDLRDKETEGHTQRVAEMTVRLAQAMGLGEAELVQVRRGALLHDIGKMGIPDGILLKPGPLSNDEWVIMRKHPEYAYNMLSHIAYLRSALDIPYCHHEKWDGTGYPRGLKGEQIPLAARLFAIVDVWDALRSDRPYRNSWADDQVLEHLREKAGTHFDPEVVEVFLGMMANKTV